MTDAAILARTGGRELSRIVYSAEQIHARVKEMGEEIVKSRVRCATLALGTLQAALDQFRRDRERREAGLPALEVKPFEV